MQETREFVSANKWFKLTHPSSWQVESEDDIYTFTKREDPNWAFQVSAYRATQDTIPDFSIDKGLDSTVESHPAAEIASLPNRKAVYYTERSGSFLLHTWLIGGKRCKVFCTYTVAASAPQDANFKAAQQAVNSMGIQ